MAENTSNDRAERQRAIGQAIRSRRETLGISQRDLSKATGFPQSEISMIENGTKSLGAARFWEIAEALGDSPSGLFTAAEELGEEIE